MYAYQQLETLGDPSATSAQSAFAAFLARRMAERGLELSTIDLRWASTNLDTGETEEHPIGTFSVGSRP